MATGKSHSRFITVTYGGQNITDSIDTINNIGITYEETDVSSLASALMEFIQGRGDLNIAVSGKFDNTATTGGHTVIEPLNGDTTGSTLTIAIGVGAAAESGDPEFECTKVGTFNYLVQANPGQAVAWSSSLRPLDGAVAAWGSVS
jgi:hypothetical protein